MINLRSIILVHQQKCLLANMVLVHSKTCHIQRRSPVYSPKLLKGPGDPKLSVKCLSTVKTGLKRALKSGPVRYGFIPEEWFHFFKPITGMSGPYVFGIVVGNYLLSKEIYIMEHEYYLGLSVVAVVYYATTRIGPTLAKSFDDEVDAIQKEWEKGRQDQKDFHTKTIAGAEDAQKRAQGQILLMDAKKENIAMQLEAAYRERLMNVYLSTKGRMDYHVKVYRSQAKIQQKWMIEWILESVRKSITPEFQKAALKAAIRDLTVIAGKAK